MTIVSATVTVNGVEYNLTPVEGQAGKYTATITAPSKSSGKNNGGNGVDIGTEAQGKGYYPVTITATDDAGNVTTVNDTDATLGAALKLYVTENVKPTCAFTSPTAGARINNSKPAINFTATDAGSGVKPDSARLTIDSGTAVSVTMTGSGSTLTGTYTPTEALAEGAHTAKLTVTDYDGNVSSEISMTFTVDTVAPTLTVTTPINGNKYNTLSLNLTGTTNDATSSPVTVTATLNGTVLPAITVNADGTFTTAFTGKVGSNELVVKARDAGGLETTVTRTFTIDTSAPVFANPELNPSIQVINGEVVFTVTLTDE